MEISKICNPKIIENKDSPLKDTSLKEREIYKVKREGADLYTGKKDGIRIKLPLPLEEIQYLYIQETLKRFKGDKDKAAESLDIKKGILTKKLNKLRPLAGKIHGSRENP